LEKLKNIANETERLKYEENIKFNIKKKPKLSWGFEPKARWERKGNM